KTQELMSRNSDSWFAAGRIVCGRTGQSCTGRRTLRASHGRKASETIRTIHTDPRRSPLVGFMKMKAISKRLRGSRVVIDFRYHVPYRFTWARPSRPKPSKVPEPDFRVARCYCQEVGLFPARERQFMKRTRRWSHDQSARS